MGKYYCDKVNCPESMCSYHVKNIKVNKNISVEALEGSIMCIKPCNKSALPVPTESEEQQTLFQWAERLCFRYPELALLYHIPNEGKRSMSTGRKLKREGLKSGIPDIHLPIARGQYHSLYIELKRKKGSSTTTAQKTWQQLLNKYGNKAVICYGWEEAARVLEDYLEKKE